MGIFRALNVNYNWHRYYDPSIGRYISTDPIGQAGGINVYSYALNNPVNLIDPDGQNPLLLAGGALAVAGFIGIGVPLGLGTAIGDDCQDEELATAALKAAKVVLAQAWALAFAGLFVELGVLGGEVLAGPAQSAANAVLANPVAASSVATAGTEAGVLLVAGASDAPGTAAGVASNGIEAGIGLAAGIAGLFSD